LDSLSPEFREYLMRVVDLPEPLLDKLVGELRDHWSETADDFVRRRHVELQRRGVPNRLVYGQIARELALRPVKSPPLSERQIRRIIYG
jgi:hypothetical protein